MNLELLPDLLQNLFGSGVALKRYKVANSQPDYKVLVVDLERPSRRVVVKLAGPSAPYACPFDRTASVHALVRANTSVPVPDVIAVDTTFRLWPWRYMIKSYIPGIEWADAITQMGEQERESAYRQIGRAIAELHTISFGAFGELEATGTLTTASSYLQTLTERATRRIKDSHKGDLFIAMLQDRANLFLGIGQPCLCHDDLHKHNILFNQEGGEWRVAAILDFDSAYAGHHESDLARLDLWRGMIGPGFWEAYAEVVPISPAYVQRRPVHQLLWCLEYESISPEHLEDTSRVYAELGTNY